MHCSAKESGRCRVPWALCRAFVGVCKQRCLCSVAIWKHRACYKSAGHIISRKCLAHCNPVTLQYYTHQAETCLSRTTRQTNSLWMVFPKVPIFTHKPRFVVLLPLADAQFWVHEQVHTRTPSSSVCINAVSLCKILGKILNPLLGAQGSHSKLLYCVFTP